MATFGGFDTVEQLYETGLAVVSAARRTDATGPIAFVVKASLPAASIYAEEEVQALIDRFLESARTQQRVAARAEHWAPVHETGAASGGAYYATDRYRRSVGDLIESKVRLGGHALHATVSGIVEGLRELARTCDRPHGNLKPTNIFLTDAAKIEESGVRLADPLPDSVAAGAERGRDLRALGELLCQLALRRPVSAKAGWSLPGVQEWAHLGPTKKAWRDLCERLLDANLSTSTLTLDDVADEVSRLKRRGVNKAAVAVVGIATVVLVAALLLGPRDGGEQAPVLEPPPWKALCDECYEWFGTFCADAGKPSRRERWAADPDIREHLLPAIDRFVKRKMDPTRIVRASGRSLVDLRVSIDALPEDVRDQVLASEARDRTIEAYEAIQSVRAFLALERQTETESTAASWTLLTRAKKLAKQCRERDLVRQAEYIDGLVVRIKPEPGLAAAVDGLLQVSGHAADIDATWERVDQDRQEIEGAGDPLLAGFGDYLTAVTQSTADEGGDDVLGDLLLKLRENRDLGRQLAEFVRGPWQTTIDQAFVQAQPPVPLPAEGAPTEQMYVRWLTKLQSGKYDLPDARSDPRSAVLDTRRRLESGVDELAAKGMADEATAFREELDRIAEQMKETQSLAWNLENQSAIREVCTAVAPRLDTLKKRIGDAVVTASATRQEYVDAQRSRRISSSDAINREWGRRLDQLDQGVEEYAALRKKVDAIERALRRLDGELPAPALGQETARAKYWQKALVDEQAQERREAALAEAVGALAWTDHELTRPEGFQAEWDQLRSRYSAWRDDLVRLLKDFDAIEERLDACFLPGEKPADDSPTATQLLDKWKDESLWADESIREALSPILDRVERLRELEGIADRRQLCTEALRAKGSTPEAARAAWLRLDDLAPSWPQDIAELQRERQMRTKLAAIYDLVDDADRRAELRRELAEAGPARWQNCFRGLNDVEDADRALAYRGEFDVDDDALDETSRFKMAICGLRKTVRALPEDATDEEVADVIGEFEEKVASLAATEKGPGREFLAELTETPDEGTASGGGLDKAGPASPEALIRWRLRPEVPAQEGEEAAAPRVPEGVEHVQYICASGDGGENVLTFVRVDPGEGVNKPFYLCLDEVSVGLFDDVLTEWGRIGLFQEILSRTQGEKIWTGPRSWEWDAGKKGLSPNSKWLLPVPNGPMAYANALYPGKPERGHPMQTISPDAALLFARLLGCRLPTSTEWLRARSQYESDTELPQWNLRDSTWARQRQYISTVNNDKNTIMPLEWPDEGIFLPGQVDSVPTRSRAGVAVRSDDHVLWFGTVEGGNGRVFPHLIGNVAEYVFDAPDAFAAALAEADAVSPEGVAGLLRSQGDKLFVIGASALSPSQEKPDRPYAVEVDDATDGFSDVGFRLAFDAPYETRAAWLKRTVEERMPRLLGM